MYKLLIDMISCDILESVSKENLHVCANETDSEEACGGGKDERAETHAGERRDEGP